MLPKRHKFIKRNVDTQIRNNQPNAKYNILIVSHFGKIMIILIENNSEYNILNKSFTLALISSSNAERWVRNSRLYRLSKVYLLLILQPFKTSFYNDKICFSDPCLPCSLH